MNIFSWFWSNIVEPSDRKRISAQTMPEGIHEVTNIAYCDDGNKYHLLDVYYPENAQGKLPAIVEIHGGGWMYGDKELNKPYCLYLAARGYVVFNMSYRLAPEVNVVEQLQDVSLALVKIQQIMPDYPCDIENVLLTGDSAGGQLAGFAVAINSTQEIANSFGFTQNSLNIRAAALTSPVCYMLPQGIMGIYTKRFLPKGYASKPYGKYLDFDELLKAAKLPPIYIVTSSGDAPGLKPSLRLEKTLRSLGVKTKLCNWGKYEGKALPHVFSTIEPMSSAGEKAITDMLEFFSSCCEAPAEVK